MIQRTAIGSGGGRLASMVIEIRLAASFLTIIPFNAGSSTQDEITASFGWFPLVGFAIGVGLACANYLLAFWIINPVRAVLMVLALALITGAVHLDGLADTADALGAGHDSSRALEIMRDSRIGSFGAVAVFLVLAVKVAVLASAVGHAQFLVLYLAPGLARWAMVATAYELKYLRAHGAGSTLLRAGDKRNLYLATAIGLLASIAVSPGPAVRASIAVVIVVWALRWSYRRWLGGITGDLIGAAGELAEAAAMIAIIA
jgi:adenosylcobinamide-GDP ribazoletransferase